MDPDKETISNTFRDAESVRVGNPSLAIRLMTPYWSAQARSEISLTSNVFDRAITLHAMRMVTVATNTLLAGRLNPILTYNLLHHIILPTRQWVEKNFSVLKETPYSAHHEDGEPPDMHYPLEYWFNDTLGTAAQVPSMQKQLIEQATSYIDASYPKVTDNNEPDQSQAHVYSAIGVGLIRIARIRRSRDDLEKGISLVRRTNGKGGPLPNPDRLAVCEEWYRNFGHEPIIDKKRLAGEIHHLYYWLFLPKIWELTKPFAD